jgi:hypothetical protein
LCAIATYYYLNDDLKILLEITHHAPNITLVFPSHSVAE